MEQLFCQKLLSSDIADTSDATYDNKYNSIVRIYGVAFVIDGQGYLTCGGTPDLRTNTWKYTPDTAKRKGGYGAMIFAAVSSVPGDFVC